MPRTIDQEGLVEVAVRQEEVDTQCPRACKVVISTLRNKHRTRMQQAPAAAERNLASMGSTTNSTNSLVGHMEEDNRKAVTTPTASRGRMASRADSRMLVYFGKTYGNEVCLSRREGSSRLFSRRGMGNMQIGQNCRLSNPRCTSVQISFSISSCSSVLLTFRKASSSGNVCGRVPLMGGVRA